MCVHMRVLEKRAAGRNQLSTAIDVLKRYVLPYPNVYCLGFTVIFAGLNHLSNKHRMSVIEAYKHEE